MKFSELLESSSTFVKFVDKQAKEKRQLIAKQCLQDLLQVM